MFPDIDPSKMLDQEPEFKAWVKEAVFFTLLGAPKTDRDNTLRMFWSLYNMGNKPEDLTEFIRNMNGFDHPDKTD